jgi:hypothetical protein
MDQSVNVNRSYKSSVFASYFNDAEKLIETYNAARGKNYPKDTKVRINTLEDALFMERINDISFLLDERLIVLIEHQSTPNENMPLRLLLYIGRVYEEILTSKYIYRSKRITIPKPDFMVFYNGDEEYPDKTVLKLSEAFANADIPDMLDLTVNVYNINEGHNRDILEKAKSLRDYAAFVSRVKGNRAKGTSLAEAVREAMLYCKRNGIMDAFLETHGSEVENMLFTEFNMDDAKAVWREEALEEGMEKGMATAAESIAVRMLLKGNLPESVAEYVELPLEKVLLLSERITNNRRPVSSKGCQ